MGRRKKEKAILDMNNMQHSIFEEIHKQICEDSTFETPGKGLLIQPEIGF